MSFWSRVVFLLERKGITRKELASYLQIDVSTISQGIKSNSIPSADIAIKTSYFLNVNIEYLVFGKSNNKDDEISVDKYLSILSKLDKLNPEYLQVIENFIEDIIKKPDSV